MTDPRVEAVARAVDPWLWNELDKPDGERYYDRRYYLYDDLQYKIARDSSLLGATQAIEASDAWLKERGWKAVPREPTREMSREQYCGPIMSWHRTWDAAPTPEDTDR